MQGSVAATTTQALSFFERAQAWGIDHAPNLIRIAGLLIAAWILSRVARKLIRRLETFPDDGASTIVSEREKRAQTLGRILRQTSFLLIWGVALMPVLGELGVDLKPILAGAGIVGLAVGFGAQTLVKDIIDRGSSSSSRTSSESATSSRPPESGGSSSRSTCARPCPGTSRAGST